MREGKDRVNLPKRSSKGTLFEGCDLMRKWVEAQRAETPDAEKAIAFSEILRRLSRWGQSTTIYLVCWNGSWRTGRH